MNNTPRSRIGNPLRGFVRFVVFAWLPLLAACGGGGDAGTTGTVQPASSGTVAKVRITPETRQIAMTETTTFLAEALDANDNVLTGKTFAFSSSRPDIASIANPAANPVTVTGVTAGVARINVSVEGKTAQASLTVGGAPDIQVNGRVIDGETGAAIAGATIDLENGSHVTAGADGSFSYRVASTRTFEVLFVSHAGYVRARVFALFSAPTTNLGQVLLLRDTGQPGSVTGTLRNARDNTPIVGGRVSLVPYQNEITALTGDRSTTTNAQGQFAFANLPRGVYSLIGDASGYAPCARNAITVSSATPLAQDLICSPASGNEIRIVLTWGSTPSDLDAHLTGPKVTGNDRFHVYYATRGSVTADPFAVLDVDATRSFGPETVTLTRLNSGVYRFSVHDFSNQTSASSTALSASGARVELYLPNATEPRRYNVPNQRGTLWTVFEITGTMASPVVTDRNEMGLARGSETVQ